MPTSLTPDDLQAAVEAGVIDAAQAEKLRALRAGAPPSSAPLGPDGEPPLADEERFRFLSGFNDVFLTIGVLLVAGAFLTATATSAFGVSWFGVLALAALTFWVLSEILVGRLRAVLPGIVLSVLFVTFAAATWVVEFHTGRVDAPNWDLYAELAFWRNPTVLFGAPALVAAIVYYIRFRLPFTLALIAFFGYAVASRGFLPEGAVPSPYVGLIYGLVVLAVALFYDSRDPRRVTRLSDCAFWLHLVAAPLIVSPVINTMGQTTVDGTASSLNVLLTVLFVGLFALAIDRRALLVSSLIYFTYAIYHLFSGGLPMPTSGAAPSSFVMTLAFVGGFVLVLGVFWHPLRNRLLPLFRSLPFGSHLPPPHEVSSPRP